MKIQIISLSLLFTCALAGCSTSETEHGTNSVATNEATTAADAKNHGFVPQAIPNLLLRKIS